MSEPVFLKRGQGLTVAELAAVAGARAIQPPEADRRIVDVAAIDRAGPADISFVDDHRHDAALRLSQAGACLVPSSMVTAVPPATVALVVDEPYLAFVRVAAALYPDAQRPSSLFEVHDIAPGAVVHATARVEAGVTIDPAAIIGPRAEVGAGTHVGPMVVIGPDVRIGRNCSLGAGASLTNALVGDGVVIAPGCRVGVARGANLAQARPASPALGRAILQDRVIVGANSVVDRGSDRDTIIGEGTTIDALVQIPADTLVGRYCRIMAGGGLQPAARIDDNLPDIDGLQFFASEICRDDASKAKRIAG